MKTCSINECVKPARTKSAELCKMHYHRQYRGRPIGDATELKRKQRNPECYIDGCINPDNEVGLCSMHAARQRRHGDPHKAIAYEDRNMPTGTAHHNWLGKDVGYTAAHDRVRRLNGSASQHACIECGAQARHWSYDHEDADENLADVNSANLVAYSDKPAHYQPRCVPCHKRFDMGRAGATPH